MARIFPCSFSRCSAPTASALGVASHWIADTFHPLLCEMEGCAVAQVCLRNGVKFMAIKSVSDCLFEHHDFAFNFPAAMKDLNRVVMAFLTQLTKE